MIIRVIDIETCGLPPDNAQIVEVATLDLEQNEGDNWVRGRAWSSLVNPGRPIPPEASAIHHITDDMVKDAPLLEDVMGTLYAPGVTYAAHQMRFERECLALSNAPLVPEMLNSSPWLCTYRVGVSLWPDSPNFQNQTLRYWLKLKLADPAAAVPHRAAGDCYVTAAILRRAFSEFVITVDEMVKISAAPVVLPRLSFGMHAMVPMADVPTGYLEWMTKQAGMDEDALHTARWHLQQRRKASRSRSPVQAAPVS